MKKLFYVIAAAIGCGAIYATTVLLPKTDALEKAERLFQKGDTVSALKILEKAGNRGDIASCRFLYHYYDSICETPSEAYAAVEEVITTDGDRIWYGNPDEKPEGARLPTKEELGNNNNVYTMAHDAFSGDDMPRQWYWLRRAAQLGDAESQCAYGAVAQLALSIDSAMVWWEKSAMQNYPQGVLFYGTELYIQALEKKSQDIGLKAFQMLTKAFEYGKELPSAGWHLGLCYINAVGTSENYEKGIDCLRQSAKYGYPEAIITMSELDVADSPYWEKKAREEGLK